MSDDDKQNIHWRKGPLLSTRGAGSVPVEPLSKDDIHGSQLLESPTDIRDLLPQRDTERCTRDMIEWSLQYIQTWSYWRYKYGQVPALGKRDAEIVE